MASKVWTMMRKGNSQRDSYKGITERAALRAEARTKVCSFLKATCIDEKCTEWNESVRVNHGKSRERVRRGVRLAKAFTGQRTLRS